MKNKTNTRILYVENDVDLHELFRLAVADKKYLVDIAYNGEDGLAMHVADPYDALVIDYQLPAMTGMDLARKLLIENNDLPIIMMTGQGNERVAVEALKLGVDQYLVKDSGNVYLEMVSSIIASTLKKADYARRAKEAERSTRENRERFQDFAELGSDWFWEMDADFRYSYMSPSHEQHLGGSSKDIIGKTRTELYANMLPQMTSDEHEQWRKFNDFIETQKPFNKYETNWMYPNGEVQYFSSSGKPFFGTDGEFKGYRGIGTNITSRKNAEKELNETLERLEEAQRIGQVGHWVWDEIEDKDIFTSPEAYRIWGMEDNQILSSWDEFLESIHPDDREHTDRIETESSENGTNYVLEYRIILPNGDIRYILERGDPVLDDDGKIIKTIGTVQNITELRHRENAISESEARYKEAARIAHMGHWIYDEVEDRLIHCSEEMARIHDLTVEQYLLMISNTEKDIERVHPDDRNNYGTVLRNAQKEATPYDVEYRIIKPDGEVCHVREVGKPVCDNTGKLIQSRGTTMDITRQKQAEEAIIASREEAKQANRSKSEFLSSMSHELRTPLNAIIGFSDMIKHEIFGPIEPHQYSEYINDIHDSGNHLLALINKVLDMSKIESGEYKVFIENVILREIIVEVLAMVKVQFNEKYIELLTELPVGAVQVKADRLVTKQILINLLTNAIKFTPEGGSVTVRVYLANDMAVVEIIDSGIGLSTEDMERALKPFIQIDRGKGSSHEGTGLGLSLCKNFVELQGGNFTLSSQKEVGTIATFTLPLSDKDTLETLQTENREL